MPYDRRWEIINDCFDGRRDYRIGGRRIECIRFAVDIVLLAEGERTLNAMLRDFNINCETCEMKIN